MVERIDPERRDLAVTRRHLRFEGSDVLEVGCGDGRMTLQYAHLARKVLAIDPNPRLIAAAKAALPRNLRGQVTYRVASGESLPAKDSTFDIVFFTWSLCCSDVPAMGRSLTEAWRVLRPRGLLASIQPSLQQDFRYGMVGYIMDRGSPAIQEEERTYPKSRLALRYSVLFAKQFYLVCEEEFPSYTYYSTEKEAVRAFILGRKENFDALNPGGRRLIREVVRDRGVRTSRGLRFTERAVLTVLRKRSRP